MVDITPNQPPKFKTKNWVEINDESCGTCNSNRQIRFVISVLKSSFCGYSDAYILVKRTILEAALATGENCAPFTDCISRIISTQKKC